MFEFLGQVLKLNIPVGWGPLTNMAAVGCLWFFLLSHLFGNYLTDSNETCLLCSTQCLVVQVQKKVWSVDKFGRLVPDSDSEMSHWQAFYRISSKTTGRIFLDLGQNVPLSILLCKKKKKKKKKNICRKTWLPSAIFMPRHQKVAGYYVIPSEILSFRPSVRPSVCLSVRPSVRPSVSAHHHSCIGNSSYSFRPILLKLYSCFKDGLKICILFFQNPEIIFYHFFPFLT